ncbi:hypothetical protein L6Q96_19270 [Candidatus Binatia bacterium]|nr:hypothetical protein [Candidatus Binatia bacterium]
MSAPPEQADRVVTFDVLRGMAIGAMVFLHNGAFHLASLGEALKSPPPWLVAFGFLLLWAGLFGVVSGAANATATMRRLHRQPLVDGRPWHYPRSLMAGAVQTFAILFVLHWVWTLVVGNSAVTEDPNDPTLRVTLVPGFIYYGFFPRIHPENWVFASALWMIGANVLLVSAALRWFYRRMPPRDDDGVQRYLFLLAAGVLLATPALRALLFEPMTKLVAQRGAAIAAAVPMALLINDPNPVFPFFAYGLLGAIAGVALVRGEPRAALYRHLGRSGLLLVLVGGLGLLAAGGIVLAEREHVWGQSPLYFAALGYALLGVFSLVLVGLLALLDPGAESRRKPWRPAALRPLLRFGRLSLTIFMLEGILGMALRVGIDTLFAGWNATVGFVLAFAVGNVLLWHIILINWERLDYRYSLEWWLARIRGTDDRARALRGG